MYDTIREVRINYLKIDCGEKKYAFGTVMSGEDVDREVIIRKSIVNELDLQTGQVVEFAVTDVDQNGDLLKGNRLLAIVPIVEGSIVERVKKLEELVGDLVTLIEG